MKAQTTAAITLFLYLWHPPFFSSVALSQDCLAPWNDGAASPYLKEKLLADVQQAEHFYLDEFSALMDYLAGIYEGKVFNGRSPKAIAALFQDLRIPDQGLPPEQLKQFLQRIVENAIHFNEMYLGHFLTTMPAVAAFMNPIIDAINANMADPQTPPLYQKIEQQTIQWVAQIAGYDARATGFVTADGTDANKQAFLTMRNKAVDEALQQAGISKSIRELGMAGALKALGKDVVVFISEEKHHSWSQLAAHLGIGEEKLISIKPDSKLGMDISDLGKKVSEARKAGKIILGIVGTFGTTETGNLDSIQDILTVAKKSDPNLPIYVHIDAAWGGPFALSTDPKMQEAAQWLSRVDSMTVDPHKMLYMPYNFGSFLVRDPETLKWAASSPEQESKPDAGIAQAPFRTARLEALKLWVTLQWMGVENYRKLIDYVLEKTKYFDQLLKEDDQFEVLTVAETNVLNFRYLSKGMKAALYAARESRNAKAIEQLNRTINAIQKEIFKELQNSGEAWISLAILKNSLYQEFSTSPSDGNAELNVFRFVLMNPFVTESSLARFQELIRNIGDQIYAQWDKAERRIDLTEKLRRREPPPLDPNLPFQAFFLHPQTREALEPFLRALYEMAVKGTEGYAVGRTGREGLEKALEATELPEKGLAPEVLLEKVAMLLQAADAKQKQHHPVLFAGETLAAALDQNVIAYEVSPSATTAERQWIHELARWFGYAEKTGTNGKGRAGGIVNMGLFNDHLTALRVAMNKLLTELPLLDYVARKAGLEGTLVSPGQENLISLRRRMAAEMQQFKTHPQAAERVLEKIPRIDLVREGLTPSLLKLRSHVAHDDKSQVVILASPQKAEEMREIAGVVGLGAENVVVVAGGKAGKLALESVKRELDAQREKGNLVAMFSFALDEVDVRVGEEIHQYIQEKFAYDVWMHATSSGTGDFFDEEKEARAAYLDSVSLDLGRLFAAPQGTRAVLFQNEAELMNYIKYSARYVFKEGAGNNESGHNIGAYSLMGSKGFYSLGVMLDLLHHGKEFYRPESRVKDQERSVFTNATYKAA